PAAGGLVQEAGGGAAQVDDAPVVVAEVGRGPAAAAVHAVERGDDAFDLLRADVPDRRRGHQVGVLPRALADRQRAGALAEAAERDQARARRTHELRVGV